MNARQSAGDVANLPVASTPKRLVSLPDDPSVPVRIDLIIIV